MSSSLCGANAYWDIDKNTNGLQAGSGDWSRSPGSADNDWAAKANPTGNAHTNAWTQHSRAFFVTSGASLITVVGTIQAASVTFSGTGYTIAGTALTLTGTGGKVTANAAASISAPLAGTVGLTKLGNATLTLSGSNTYSGGTIISAGTLKAAGLGALGAGAIVNNGTLELSGNVGDVVGGSITHTISGTGNLIRSFSGVGVSAVSLAGPEANTFSGLTTVSSGTLRFEKPTGINAVGGNILISGGALILRSGEQIPDGSTLTLTGGTFEFASPSAGGKTETLNTIGKTAGNLRTNGNTLAVSNLTLSGDLGDNRISGNADGNAGTLRIDSGGAGLVFIGSTGPILHIDSASGGTANRLLLKGNLTSSVTAGTVRILSDGSATNAGVIDLDGGNRTFTVADGSSTTDMSVSATIANGSLSKAGAGTLALTAGNTHAGETTISQGVLNIQHATALGTTSGGTSVAGGAALEIEGGITVGSESLVINGSGISSGGSLRNMSGENTFGGLITLGSSSLITSDSGSLSLSNSGIISGAGHDLSVSGDGNISINGAIGTGTGRLVKSGNGNLTLSGANTYVGNTNVSGGSLAVNGSITSAVTVANGAALQGTGMVTGNTLIQSGGTFAAGSGLGTLTQSGDLTFNSGSIFEWELDSSQINSETNRGVAYDAANVAGGLAGSGAIFKIVLTGTQTFSDLFWYEDRNWANIFTGIDGSSVKANWASVFSSFQFSYNGQTMAPTSGYFTVSENSLNWHSTVPEPTNAIATLLVAAGLLRRRRLIR